MNFPPQMYLFRRPEDFKQFLDLYMKESGDEGLAVFYLHDHHSPRPATTFTVNLSGSAYLRLITTGDEQGDKLVEDLEKDKRFLLFEGSVNPMRLYPRAVHSG